MTGYRPPRWPRGRTSRRAARVDATTSSTISQTISTTTRRAADPLAKNARYPGFAPCSASIRLTVRMTWCASPESRLPRLAPPSLSRPLPVDRRFSRSAQSEGDEQVMSRPVSFSSQLNAGMSSFAPSRIPAWEAPVWDERSVSHSMRWCEPSVTQDARTGALPSRIAWRRTSAARPSISR